MIRNRVNSLISGMICYVLINFVDVSCLCRSSSIFLKFKLFNWIEMNYKLEYIRLASYYTISGAYSGDVCISDGAAAISGDAAGVWNGCCWCRGICFVISFTFFSGNILNCSEEFFLSPFFCELVISLRSGLKSKSLDLPLLEVFYLTSEHYCI